MSDVYQLHGAPWMEVSQGGRCLLSEKPSIYLSIHLSIHAPCKASSLLLRPHSPKSEATHTVLIVGVYRRKDAHFLKMKCLQAEQKDILISLQLYTKQCQTLWKTRYH